MIIIAVANQKGGAGKSTTATCLTAGLYAKGYKTLLVDMDAQGNATTAVGASGKGKGSTYDVLVNDDTEDDNVINQAILNVGDYGDIIPASAKLSKVELELANEVDKFIRLKEALQQVKYDYVIIDTPPSLGVLTMNALIAATGVIIPVEADNFGIDGIRQLYSVIMSVKKKINKTLKIYGILLTRHDSRQRLSQDYAEGIAELAKEMETKLFSSHIRANATIRKAQARKKTIFKYDLKSNGATDYSAFVAEFLAKNKEGGAKNVKKRIV